MREEDAHLDYLIIADLHSSAKLWVPHTKYTISKKAFARGVMNTI